jgi:osmotically-inducible protein OsmY
MSCFFEWLMSTNNLQYQDDETLRTKVMNTLASDSRFCQLSLRVGVRKGIVHLGGNVPTFDVWIQVEQRVAKIPAVRGVVNRMRAPGAPSSSRTIHLETTSFYEKGEHNEREP